MPDPITLTVLGGAALAKGIDFLYGQAGILLDRWRARHDRDAAAQEALPAAPSADALDGQLSAPRPDWQVVDRLAGDVERLRGTLSSYVEGERPVRSDDEQLVEAAEELRTLLELALGQRITFRGEPREPTGTRVVEVRAQIDEVERARAVGLRARKLPLGSYVVDQRIGKLRDGEAIGFELGDDE